MAMKLSIIIPLFNEEGNIYLLIKEIITALQSISGNYEIILINDGSTDCTLEEMSNMQKQKTQIIKLLSYKKNHGKGWAIRAGLEASWGDYICLEGKRADHSTQSPFPPIVRYSRNRRTITTFTSLYHQTCYGAPRLGAAGALPETC